MSKESLEQFMEKVGSDDELRSSIESQLDSDGNISVDALIAFGADNGCDFTVDDLEGAAELSDKQLEGVAGGSYTDAAARGAKRAVKVHVAFSKRPIPNSAESDIYTSAHEAAHIVVQQSTLKR